MWLPNPHRRVARKKAPHKEAGHTFPVFFAPAWARGGGGGDQATRSAAYRGEVNAVSQEWLNCMVWLLQVARVPYFFLPPLLNALLTMKQIVN